MVEGGTLLLVLMLLGESRMREGEEGGCEGEGDVVIRRGGEGVAVVVVVRVGRRLSRRGFKRLMRWKGKGPVGWGRQGRCGWVELEVVVVVSVVVVRG